MKVTDYYRRITELLPLTSLLSSRVKLKRLLRMARKNKIHSNLLNLLLLFFFLLPIFLLINLGLLYSDLLKAKQVRVEASKTLNYWEDVVRKHPNFPDGFYNAAVYAAKVRETEKALIYLDKAIRLDPTFTKAMELKKRLGNEF